MRASKVDISLREMRRGFASPEKELPKLAGIRWMHDSLVLSTEREDYFANAPS